LNLPALLRDFGISFIFLAFAMSVHEFAHGWLAHILGDQTAKNSGRLTLNPLAHIDPLGTFILPLTLFLATNGNFIFGSAKPVPINFNALRNPKKDIIWIGVSGPLANLFLAFFLTILWKAIPYHSPQINVIFLNFIIINILLGVFNLIPIPPLDGSRVISGFLPANLARKYAMIEPFGFIIILFLFWFKIFHIIVWPVIAGLIKLLGITA